MTALPHASGVVRRLHDAVTRDVPTQVPPLATGLVVTHNEAAELLDLIGRLCPDHLVCATCGGHQCPTCDVDGAAGPWCTEHGAEPLCRECAGEFCRACVRLDQQEARVQ